MQQQAMIHPASHSPLQLPPHPGLPAPGKLYLTLKHKYFFNLIKFYLFEIVIVY